MSENSKLEKADITENKKNDDNKINSSKTYLYTLSSDFVNTKNYLNYLHSTNITDITIIEEDSISNKTWSEKPNLIKIYSSSNAEDTLSLPDITAITKDLSDALSLIEAFINKGVNIQILNYNIYFKAKDHKVHTTAFIKYFKETVLQKKEILLKNETPQYHQQEPIINRKTNSQPKITKLVEKIIELLKEHKTIKEISQETGKTRNYLYQLIKRHKLTYFHDTKGRRSNATTVDRLNLIRTLLMQNCTITEISKRTGIRKNYLYILIRKNNLKITKDGRSQRKRINDEIVIKLAQYGYNIKEIAIKLNVAESSLRNYLFRNKHLNEYISPGTNSKISEKEMILKITSCLEEGMSVKEISEKLSRSLHHIYNFIRTHPELHNLKITLRK